jgi:hypothetical protein
MLLALPILASIRIALNALEPHDLFGALTTNDAPQQHGPDNAYGA